jgi:hypothetical protein
MYSRNRPFENTADELHFLKITGFWILVSGFWILVSGNTPRPIRALHFILASAFSAFGISQDIESS